MVLGAASLQLCPFTDTDPLFTFPQVSVHPPSSPLKFKAFHRNSPRLAAATSAVASAEFLTQKTEPHRNPSSSQNPKTERASQHRKGLRALSELLPPQSVSEELRSHNDSPTQALQRLGESSASQIKPKNGTGSDQWRNPLFLDPPTHLQQDDRKAQAADLGSSHVEQPPPIKFSVNRRKKVPPPKRWGSKHSSRGFDVLDDLMSSQGRSSKALLESLQAEVALEKDKMLIFGRESAEDAQMNPYIDRKAPAGEYSRGNHGGPISQAFSESGRVRRWNPIHEDTTNASSTSSTFASSIEKALLPSVAAEPSNATNASTRNASIMQSKTSSANAEDVSNTVQPGLRGQEVLWALQKAALEKAKQKQKNRKPNDRASKGMEIASLHDSGEWRNAKPIVLKPEWALEIDELERRIEKLKYSILSS